MKHLQILIVSFTLTLTLSVHTVHAGGWPQPKGGAFLKVGHMFTRASNLYDENGDITSIRTLGTYSTSFYGEYGFSKRLTGVLYFPLLIRNTLNRTVGQTSGLELEPGATNTAPGDADIGLRYNLLNKNSWVLSTSLTLGVPVGDARDENALVTGDGEFNQLLKLEAGYGTSKWYAAGAIGLNHRTRGFSEEFRYEGEVGIKLFKNHVLAALKLFAVESFGNGNAANNSNGLFANNVEYLSFGPELSYTIKEKFGLTVGYLTAARGQNVLAAPAGSFGAFLILPGK